MSKKILISGATGFIGRHIAQQLNVKKHELSLLVRPDTSKARMSLLPENAEVLSVDLRDIKGLRQKLSGREFDVIVHVGAIRNRKGTTELDYQKANVDATEQLALKAMDCGAKFIYFSSVGVFGSVPRELPAGAGTAFVGDNLYHASKIRSEKLINHYVLYGLQSAIIRPAITYGVGDYGFPYNFIKMTDKRQLLLPIEERKIHLVNVELLVMSVQRLVENDYTAGVIYNIADSKPVSLRELADHISQQLRGKPYPRSRFIPAGIFRVMAKLSHIVGNKNWEGRFLLFSNNWYYEVEKSYNELKLRQMETLTGLRSVIQWYQSLKKKKT